jgi:hypothetical protein
MKVIWKCKMLFCVAGDDEGGGVSEEATGEDEQVSCRRDRVPTASNVDMLCSCSTKLTIILAI